MSFLFGRSPAKQVADEILNRFAKHCPDLHPITHDRGAKGLSIELPGAWLLELDNVHGGVEARILRPGMPGQDGGPILVKIYHYESIAIQLWQYSLQKFDLYDLRADAVYQVIQDFQDFYKNEFKTGTRLTFVERHYLPYENGNTLIFKVASGAECRMYLQDGDLVYARFADYIGLAPDNEQLVPARPSPFGGGPGTPLSGGEGQGER